MTERTDRKTFLRGQHPSFFGQLEPVCEIEKQQGGGGSNRSRLKASPTFSHLGGGAGPHVQPPAIAQHGFLLTVGPGDEFITSQGKTTTTPVTKVHHTIAAVSSCEAEKLVK